MFKITLGKKLMFRWKDIMKIELFTYHNILMIVPIFLGCFRYLNMGVNLTAIYLLTILIFILLNKKYHIQFIYLSLLFFPFIIYSLLIVIIDGSLISHSTVSYYLFSISSPLLFATLVKREVIDNEVFSVDIGLIFLIFLHVFLYIFFYDRTEYVGSLYQFSGDWLLLFLYLNILSGRVTLVTVGLVFIVLVIVGSRAALLTCVVMALPMLFRPRMALFIFVSLILLYFADVSSLPESLKLRVLVDIIEILNSDAGAVLQRGIGDRIVYHNNAVMEFFQQPVWGNPGYFERDEYAHTFANVLASWGVVGTILYLFPLLMLIGLRVVDLSTYFWLFSVLITYSLFRSPETFFYAGLISITFAWGVFSRKKVVSKAL